MNKTIVVKNAGMQAGGFEMKGKRKVSLPSGCILSVITNDNFLLDDRFKMDYQGNDHYFKIIDISITEDFKLELQLAEVGYWDKKFDRYLDFDIRTMIGCELVHVTDRDTLNKIAAESLWT